MGLYLRLAIVLGAAGPPAATGRFADIAVESGLAAVVQQHYARVPKWWLSGLDLVDLDSDGDLDVHLGGHGSTAAAAWNDGRGHFICVDPNLPVPRGVRAHEDLPYPGGEIRLAYDFNEDGRVDLHCAWHDDGGALYLNHSRCGSPPSWNFRRSRWLDHFSRAAAMADLDGDGSVDYLADSGGRRGGDAGLLVLSRDGSGAFTRSRTVPGLLQESGAIPADVDGDGDLDLLVSRRGYSSPGRRILRHDGQFRFTDVTQQAGLTEEGGSIHGAGDIDQDGDVDLIAVEGDRIVLYRNDGHGGFARAADAIDGMASLRASAKPRSTNWGGAVVTDMDNDGRADVLVAGKYFLAVLRGEGAGRFRHVNELWGLPTGAWSAVDEGLCFGDIDGDGDLDLLACAPGPGDRQKGAALLRNDVAAGRWLRVRLVGSPGRRSAAGAKIRLFDRDTRRLLWYEQVAIWGRQSFHSYYAAAETERHFGLGDCRSIGVRVEFYPSGRTAELEEVQGNSTVVVRE